MKLARDGELMKNILYKMIRTVVRKPEGAGNRKLDGTEAGRLAEQNVTTVDDKAIERSVVAEHFDAPYYLSTNPDVARIGHDPLDHFLQYGWREGRNPTPWFRTQDYLEKNKDYLGDDLNPFYAYLVKREDPTSIDVEEVDGAPVPSAGPAIRQVVASHFDAAFYSAQNGDVAESGVDPLDHFLEYGWREMRNPTAWFDTGEFLKTRPDIAYAGVNPFYHYLIEQQQSQAGAAPEARNDSAPASADAAALNFQRSKIEPYFNREYYLKTYADIATAGVDPLAHFVAQGWHEGRNPTASFDVTEYLRLNPDVRSAGVNPFYHYIVVGKSEGRQVKSEHFAESRIIASARSMSARAMSDRQQTSHRVALNKGVLADYLARLIPASRTHIVVSISHDDYTGNYGGIQNCIGQEQKSSNALGISYVHISPANPTLYFNPKSEDDHDLLTIIVDGERIGHARESDLFSFLSQRATSADVVRYLVIHSFLGFSKHFIIKLHRTLQPLKSLMWIHDCSTLCTNYALLRNDIEFCWAPALESASCTVCVYGSERSSHLKAMRQMFAALEPTVIFPSETMRDFWLDKSDFAIGNSIVSPHAHALFSDEVRDKKVGRTVKVAFVGMASAHKGWHVFTELAEACRRDFRYSFFHFATLPGEPSSVIQFVPTTVTAHNPSAMINALVEKEVDIVIQWSLCFETFSFSTLESILAGAYVIGRRGSGNAAKIIEDYAAGMLFDNKKELIEFFSSTRAYSQLRTYRSRPVAIGSIELSKPNLASFAE